MTGNDVYKLFLNKIDKSYSKFVDKVKLNRFFRMALYDLVERKYMGLATQKEYDELRSQISTEKVYSVTSDKIAIAPLAISNVTYSGSLVTVETVLEHNIADGQVVTISGVNGITTLPNINGDITVYNSPTSKSFTFVSSFAAGTYTDGGVVTYESMISDYLHYFTVKCKTKEFLRGLSVKNIINRTPCIVEFSKPNNLATGEQVSLENNTSLVGTFYYESINDYKGKLWYNKELTNPVIFSGATNVGGMVYRVYYNYAEPLYSDRKISDFELSKADSPKVQTADSFLKFSPSCSEITIDYMARPKKEIDCTDDTFNLELVYPAKFLYLLIDQAIIIYTSPSRDVLLNQLTTKDITN